MTLFDSTCIIVGIILGIGVYRSSPDVARDAGTFGWLMAVWLAGGVLSLIGSLCYAELATAYPEEGGDYVYLRRAFGRLPAFLFAWSQFWIVRPGSIGAMAYIFAQYANELWPQASGQWEGGVLIAYAVLPVVLLTAINVVGVREGKWTQNVLTTVKIAGPVALAAAGLLFPAAGAAAAVPAAPSAPGGHADFYMAMILVLWTYGGWNEMAYVAAEVRRPEKNIVRALVLGTAAITVIYLLLNFVFVYALGFEGMGRSKAVAADVLQLALGIRGARVISLMICISALGAINGLIFTGARIFYATGKDHALFARLGQWHPRRGTPLRSLVWQAAIVLALIVGFGLWTGGKKGGFQSMIEFTSPIFWAFFLLVGFSLFVLRWREPGTPRPYRVPWYPVPPVLFCLSSLFMLYACLRYALEAGSTEPVWAVVLMSAGILVSFFDRRRASSDPPAPAPFSGP